MKDKTYIMIGMPIISKEVFRKILRPLNNYSFKPSGGFWASEHNGNICNISDWYNYLLNADSIARYKNMNQSVIFTLKESANILFIDSQEQILKLASLYPSYHHILGYYKETTSNSTIFDFETLQEEYDGIYINYNKIYNSNKTIVFDDWKSNTLLLFNLNCIKEYKSAYITYDIENKYSIPYIKESDIKSSKKIEEETSIHKELLAKSLQVYTELTNKNNNIRNYHDYLLNASKNITDLMKIIKRTEEKNIKEIINYINSNNINICQDHLIQTFALDTLSTYLKQDQKNIKKLEKSKESTPKWYKI